jgi:hypothetical protein
MRPPFIPARDDGNGELLSEKYSNGGVDIKEYFQRLKTPPSLHPSPLTSPSPNKFKKKNVSLTEF